MIANFAETFAGYTSCDFQARRTPAAPPVALFQLPSLRKQATNRSMAIGLINKQKPSGQNGVQLERLRRGPLTDDAPAADSAGFPASAVAYSSLH
jgi:hypothetical protein